MYHKSYSGFETCIKVSKRMQQYFVNRYVICISSMYTFGHLYTFFKALVIYVLRKEH